MDAIHFFLKLFLLYQLIEGTMVDNQFIKEKAWEGLLNPVAVRFAPDGKVFICLKEGQVVMLNHINDKNPKIFADLSSSVLNWWDRGLLSLEIHPEWPTKPYIYVFYAADAPPG